MDRATKPEMVNDYFGNTTAVSWQSRSAGSVDVHVECAKAHVFVAQCCEWLLLCVSSLGDLGWVIHGMLIVASNPIPFFWTAVLRQVVVGLLIINKHRLNRSSRFEDNSRRFLFAGERFSSKETDQKSHAVACPLSSTSPLV